MTCAGLSPIQTASILLLPSEILVRIFEEVYFASCDLNLDYAPSSKLSDPALFPHCLAKVCKRWKKLVRSVPLFATRVMVFVDESIVLDELSAQFAASKSLLIKVFVVRRQYPEGPDFSDPLEKCAVRHVVKALAPHIARCQVLVFDLMQSASLPHITDFSGTAPKLRTLRVKCRRADHIEDVRVLSRRSASSPKVFLCPNLQYLDLHGHIFLEALRIPQWQESIRRLSKKQLSVSHIHGIDASGFNLRDLIMALAKLGHLTKLHLSDIELDHTSCLDRGSPATIFIQNFVFEDLSRDFINGFVEAYDNEIDVSSLVLRRCQLGKIRYFASWNLTLDDVPADEDIPEFISHWDGFSLRLVNCAGADDRLLELLSTVEPASHGLYAPTLRELHITFTPASKSAVSMEAIRHLVMRRQEESDKYPALSPLRPLPMHSVHVRGPTPPLAPEDKMWFEENLEFFSWSTTRDSCDSPVLDGDCLGWDFSQFDDREVDALVPLSTAESSMASELEGLVLLPAPESSMSSQLYDAGLDDLFILPTQESGVPSQASSSMDPGIPSSP